MASVPTSSEVERERLDLDRRKIVLEESWPRKWGAVLISGAATLSAAIVTAGVAIKSQSATDAQRQVENDRTALDMYFRYIAEKPDNSPHRSEHIHLIGNLLGNPQLIKIIEVDNVGTQLARRSGDTPPSAIVVGLPDVQSQAIGHVYGPADFLTYVQYARPRSAESQRLTIALGNLGLRVPGQQSISPEKSPGRDEIRIYRADHAHYAATLAVQLKQVTGLDFVVRGPIGGGRLPNGVMEIWLGNAG